MLGRLMPKFYVILRRALPSSGGVAAARERRKVLMSGKGGRAADEGRARRFGGAYLPRKSA
jgi:hypothetical protein